MGRKQVTEESVSDLCVEPGLVLTEAGLYILCVILSTF